MQILFLLLGLAFLVCGVMRGEADTVLNKAIKLCLECATPKEYDGYKISSLEGQMAINALESMKDDGRAAIIIGGKTEYAKNGSLNPKDKAFLGYLYSCLLYTSPSPRD